MKLLILLFLITAVVASDLESDNYKNMTASFKAHLRAVGKIRTDFREVLHKLNTIPTVVSASKHDPDVYRTSVEIIMSKGYPLETHYIVTEDGYILTAWRIKKNVTQKHPVMLQHGLLDCSFSWIINVENQALPYILADAGYDVWVTNNRGNRYSKTHVKYNQNDNYAAFWNFSWDEMAKYDLPANTEYIKKTAGVNKIHYIGHSQGSTQWLAHQSANIDSQVNYKTFVGLGPAMYVQHVAGVFSYTLIEDLLYQVMKFLGMGQLLTLPGDDDSFLGEICDYSAYMCQNVIKLIVGFTQSNHFNVTRLSVMSSHEPGGASLRTLNHWIQMVGKPGFPYYDFGPEANVGAYGQKAVPQYPVENLRKLTMPILLVQGGKDVLVSDVDFQGLLSLMPADVQTIIVKDWNHLDYLWAMDATTLAYPQILKFLNEADAN
jgi:pimeloyl-ACP methyl ester carboxylesterase